MDSAIPRSLDSTHPGHNLDGGWKVIISTHLDLLHCFKIYSASGLVANTVIRSVRSGLLPLAELKIFSTLRHHLAGIHCFDYDTYSNTEFKVRGIVANTVRSG